MPEEASVLWNWKPRSAKLQLVEASIACNGQMTTWTDTAPLLSAEKREGVLDRFCHYLQGAKLPFSEEDKAKWRRALVLLGEEVAKAPARTDGEPDATSEALTKWEPSAKAKEEGAKLLERPDLLGQIVDTVAGLGVVGERPLVALAYLVATSRLLEKPLYLLVQGEPASGKSFILDAVCETFPPHLVESITDCTSESLYYLAGGTTLRNRVLRLGERRRQRSEESIDATKALRELHESGRLSKLVPVKRGGRLVTARVTLEGAPAILESASHNAIPPEDLSRAIVAWTDESESQTRAVLRGIAEAKAGGQSTLPPEKLEAAWAAQHLLEPYVVATPFLRSVAERFPARSCEARRVFVRLALLTEASALLHQRQRRIEGDCLIAELDDFKLAWKLLSPWLKARLIEGPTPAAQRIWEAIRNRPGELTAKELSKQGLGDKSTIGRALRYLESVGAVECLPSEGKYKPYRVVNPAWTPEDIPLPDGLDG